MVTDQDLQPPALNAFRPFIICTPENYAETIAFYSDLGFEILFNNKRDICGFATGLAGAEFLVSLHYGIRPPRNAMMQFHVDDARAWYEYMMALDLERRHPKITITPPVVTDWGWLITYVADPAGVKLHFGQFPVPATGPG